MRVLTWLTATLLVVVLLLMSFFLLVRSPEFYRLLMKANSVYETIDLSEEQVNEAADVIAGYMIGSEPHLLIEHASTSLFKAQEVFHMYEVRRIFATLRTGLIFAGLLLFGLMVLLKRERWLVLRRQFYVMLGLTAVLGGASFFFDQAFLWMHQTLFNNLFWAFRADHYLIRLLPTGFFLGFLMATGILTLFFSIILSIASRQHRLLEK